MGSVHCKGALRRSSALPAECGQETDVRVCVHQLGRVPFHDKQHLRHITCPFQQPDSLGVSKAQGVIALSSAESELCTIGTGPGEATGMRSFLLETRLWGKLGVIILETDSSSGKASATTFGATKMSRYVQPRCVTQTGVIPEGVAKLRKVCGEPCPSDILTKFAKTDVFLLHTLRFNMITSHDHVFTIASVFVASTDCEPSLHDVVIYSPATTSCSGDASSASSSQHLASGKIRCLQRTAFAERWILLRCPTSTLRSAP